MSIIHKFKKLDTLYNKDTFILSALNLAFIGYLTKNKIVINENYYLWPDGIISMLFGFDKKIPGRTLINEIQLDLKKIKQIVLLGNTSKNIEIFIEKKFKIKLIHFSLPIGDTSEIIKKLPKIYEDNLYIITLPTPKQEIIASHISKKNKFFKLICIGGGLEIAAGDVKLAPVLLEKIGAEFIWRLRTDFFRRLIRLLETMVLFVAFWFSKNKRKLFF